MTKLVLPIALLTFAAIPLFAHDVEVKFEDPGLRLKIEYDDEYNVYKKHDDIIVESEDDDDDGDVVISAKGELWVNGDKVRVNRRQRELLLEYHDLATSLLDKAEDIGEEGVKIGLKGAELGIRAASGVFRILLPGYTAKDFENDMEKAADKIEKKADKLEAKADALEAMSDTLLDIHHDLRQEIDELQELDWF